MFVQRSFRFWVYLALYALMLWASVGLLDREHRFPMLARMGISFAPMLPAFGILATLMSRYRTLDELQRRIQGEAIVFAFGASAIVTFSYGFLENVGAPVFSYFWVWPIMAIAWSIGLVIAGNRYR